MTNAKEREKGEPVKIAARLRGDKRSSKQFIETLEAVSGVKMDG